MLKPPKRLKIITSPVEHSQQYMRLEVDYGSTGWMGNLVVQLDDLAEFVEALKAGFDEHITLVQSTYPRKA
jgi:hypothetical protein